MQCGFDHPTQERVNTKLLRGWKRLCRLEGDPHSSMNPTPPSEMCVSYNLRKASRIVSKVYTKEMRSAPVRGPQYSLMMMIARREHPTISEIADSTGADRTTMTRNLGHLQRRGFIRIVQGKNLRSKAVELTPKGKAAIERSVPCWRKAQAKVLKLLGADRWDRMLTDLTVLSTLTAKR